MHLPLSVALLVALSGVACNSDGATKPRGELRVLWRSPPVSLDSHWLGGTPAVDGGRVFVQEGNKLVAFQAADGKRLWARQIRVAPSPPPSTLLAADGRVFVSETDSIMAIDASTGATLWNVHPDSQAVVVPALDESTLYTGQRGLPVVYALARDNGALRWKVNTGIGYTYTAHVHGLSQAGDTVYVAQERYLSRTGKPSSGVLVALDRRTGRELWRYDTGGPTHYFRDAPVVKGPLVILNDYGSGDLVAIDTRTQREAWRTPNGGGTRIVVSGSTAITGAVDTKMRGIDVQTGAVKWSASSESSALGVGVCGGNAYVTAFVLRRVDVATGAVTGDASSTEADFESNVASDGSRIFVSGTATFAFAC